MKLGELIRTRKDQLGQTWPELVAKARQRGYKIARGTLLDIVTNEIDATPKVVTLRAIAAAIEVPVSDVFHAAGESLGLEVVGPTVLDHGAHMFAAIMAGRTEEEKAKILKALALQVELLELGRQSAPAAPTGGGSG